MIRVVAIDGPAAAGKGTLARRVAAAFALPYLDTGLLYRAVGRKLLLDGQDPQDEAAATRAAIALRPPDLHRTDLRDPAADYAASLVAAVPAVRAALLAFQRDFAHAGAVLDGRDIGTVIFPDAPVKLFVTATVQARAHRRWQERTAKGEDVSPLDVETEMRARDAKDMARAAAPLRPAADAVVLDTTELSAEDAFLQASKIIKERIFFF